MVRSDCHDPHGQYLDNLREETVNMVCYRCHAEKQGPFAFEHPPVTQRLTICHEPHGTVANNLLQKPVTFLCYSVIRATPPTRPPTSWPTPAAAPA